MMQSPHCSQTLHWIASGSMKAVAWPTTNSLSYLNGLKVRGHGKWRAVSEVGTKEAHLRWMQRSDFEAGNWEHNEMGQHTDE